MKCEQSYCPEQGAHVWTFEFSDSDLRRTKFSDLDMRMIRGLGAQLEKDLNVEGALMIAQQYAAAIQRSIEEG